jgi:hypothetical protein
MLIALWLIWVSNGANGAAHVGDFSSMATCQNAANQHQHIGKPENGPAYSFICVQAR